MKSTTHHPQPARSPFALSLVLAFALSVLVPVTSAQEEGAPEPGPSFSGLWETTYGRMLLTQEGAAVRGEYSYSSSSTLLGDVEGSRLTFKYSEAETAGEGWFELSADGESMRGRWREEGSERWQRWRGSRVHPEKGVVWLVILEAHWETSLAEEEYAFGDMLRSYFTMDSARHVRVRHRNFHGVQDLQRWSREARYLAEPVVLLISTHGTPRGVQVFDEIIGAEALADCVRGHHNLKALHLSGCSMMAGDIPADIQKLIGPEQRLPITGYTTDVAWDASALSDFVYLSMLLIHGMEPAEAVAQTHVLAPFSREDPLPGATFQALGLRVLDAVPPSVTPPSEPTKAPAGESQSEPSGEASEGSQQNTESKRQGPR